MERTGQGDPAKVIPLLWRTETKPGRSGLTVDGILDAAISLADEVGIGTVSMRKLADRLGVGTMTLYSHIPGRAELLDLMVDQTHREVCSELGPDDGNVSTWRTALVDVADRNRGMLQRHPWLMDLDTSRPPLGPGTLAKYDHELRALMKSGLSDVDIDQALTLVLNHTKTSTRALIGRLGPDLDGSADDEWWEQSHRLLAAFTTPDDFPAATQVGTSAGEEYGAAADPARAYSFGLEVILTGIGLRIAAAAT